SGSDPSATGVPGSGQSHYSAVHTAVNCGIHARCGNKPACLHHGPTLPLHRPDCVRYVPDPINPVRYWPRQYPAPVQVHDHTTLPNDVTRSVDCRLHVKEILPILDLS